MLLTQLLRSVALVLNGDRMLYHQHIGNMDSSVRPGGQPRTRIDPCGTPNFTVAVSDD